MSRRWCHPKPLGVAVQALQLSRAFPTAQVFLRSGLLTWEAQTVPHPGANRYDLRMTYRLGERPHVRIVDPDLKGLASGKKVPHLFSQIEQTLCLHYHGVWKSNMLLAAEIVPWAILWTEYFEWWLVTGEWTGDEVDHVGRKA